MTDRPIELPGKTHKMKTGCGSLYVTVNCDETNKPIECFARIGKAGGCASSQCEALGRIVSEALQGGITPDRLVKHLIGIQCHMPSGNGDARIGSCADALGRVLKRYVSEE